MSDYQNRIIDYRLMKASELADNPLNWRQHPDKQRGSMTTVLQRVGWVGAALYNQRTERLIDGHLRKDVAGDTEIPVLVVDLSEEEEREVLATYDPIAALAGYDAETFQALTVDMDLELSDFFSDEDFAGLFPDDAPPPAEDAGPQMDRAAELQEQWQVQVGDVWEIPSASVPGKVHRLVCGDCTDAEVVAGLMRDELSPLMVTDPPYNVAEATTLYAQDNSKALKDLALSSWDRGFDPIEFLTVSKPALSSHSWQYIFTAHHMFGGIFDWLNENHAKAGFCVWCKPNPMPSLAKVVWTFAVEMCLYGKTGSPVFNYPDGEHCLNWWTFTKNSDGTHPTQKPIELIEHIIKHCSSSFDIVTDFFLGSGTTMVAAERTARLCYGIEIEPKYCAVILQRLTDLGLSPRRVDSLGT